MNNLQRRESTKTTSKAVAIRIWKQREAEIALGKFKGGWSGERILFEELSEEYEALHVVGLSESSKDCFKWHKKNLVGAFSGLMLTEITSTLIKQYKQKRKQQPVRNNSQWTAKGATVNRELETLQGLFKMAIHRKYTAENPTVGVEHYPGRRELPPKKHHTLEEFVRILEAAPIHLRVEILLLEQTGNRTYTELLSLNLDRVDFDAGLIRLGSDLQLKTDASAMPQPLSSLALKVLRWWKDQLPAGTRYLFPSPCFADRPITSVKTSWTNTLKRAGVPYFPVYQLRHAFCTRMGKVAADAVLTQVMRHSNPETKRDYLLVMHE